MKEWMKKVEELRYTPSFDVLAAIKMIQYTVSDDLGKYVIFYFMLAPFLYMWYYYHLILNEVVTISSDDAASVPCWPDSLT